MSQGQRDLLAPNITPDVETQKNPRPEIVGSITIAVQKLHSILNPIQVHYILFKFPGIR